jgi:RNA polymerase sigma-70 factor (family 1)
MPTSSEQDRIILDQLKQGDKAAFCEIYDRYWYKIYLVFYRRLKSKEISEELVQNLFMRLWERRDRLSINQLENYLFTAARNSFIDYISSQAVAANYVNYFKTTHAAESNVTEQIVEFDDLSEAIEKGLHKLPSKTSEVFRLSKLNNWPIAKISKHLSLSEKTVEYHLTKSLKFMKVYLREFTSLMAILFHAHTC